MTVINPCDYHQTKMATIAIADHQGPAYLRFGRPSWPMFTENMPFEIGKALHLNEGNDITIIATGHLVWNSIEAAKQLQTEGIFFDLINIHTIKPLDKDAILNSAKKTGRVLVAEEHNIIGGLGESIKSIIYSITNTYEFCWLNDTFGESGKVPDLIEKYGLDAKSVYNSAKELLNR